jgi:hypothetical protein
MRRVQWLLAGETAAVDLARTGAFLFSGACP